MAHRAEPHTAAPRPSAGAPHVRAAMVGVDQASIMGMELVAAILTWSGIGWLVDRWLGTAPWFLVIGGLIGNAAGLYLIWLRSGRMEGQADDRDGATPASAGLVSEGGA
jgi:F0F1-type ATP synthase assembly protein I